MTSKNTPEKIVATCYECNRPLAANEEHQIPMLIMDTTTFKRLGRFDLSACAACKSKCVEACKRGDTRYMPKQ